MQKNIFSVANSSLQTGLLLFICILLWGSKERFKIPQAKQEEAIIKEVGSSKIKFEPTESLYYDPIQFKKDSIRESRTNVKPQRYEYDN